MGVISKNNERQASERADDFFLTRIKKGMNKCSIVTAVGFVLVVTSECGL